jgi:UDP-N-acetylglucosamine transferase subunit ALG13
MTIFVSVGANPHPFDRLVKKIDDMVGSGELTEEVVLQIGTTKYVPQHIKRVKVFWGPGEYEEILKKCSMIISHAGLGNAMLARDYRKPLILVPRLKEHGEHIDNHQVQIAKYLETSGFCQAVYDIDKLPEAIRKVQAEGVKVMERKEPELVEDVKKYVESVMG